MNAPPAKPMADLGWTVTAWEGVRFETPMDWHALTLAPGYLVLGPAESPAFELKIHAGAGRPVSERQLLARLARRRNGLFRRDVREEPLPDHWHRRLQGFSATGFSWKRPDCEGIGAVLVCPACSGIHLLQFMTPPVRDPDVIARVLGSIRDHQDDGWRAFRVFDIQGKVPPGYHTDRCRFEPGRFDIGFSSRDSRLRLLRWSPADVLLKNMPMETFLAHQGLLPADREQHAAPANAHSEWHFPMNPPVPPWRIRLRGQKRGVGRVRAVHRKDSNRILAISAESPEPMPEDLFETMWSAYGTVV